MKLVQAIKERRDLQIRMGDLRQKILNAAAYLSVETPVYGTKEEQTKQVRSWLQSHSDLAKRFCLLSLAITSTNSQARVDIAIGGKLITKSITEWILRRHLLAELERQAWAACGDRNLKEGKVKMNPDAEPVEITIVRCYDPAERDRMVEEYRSEPTIIDGALEVANAITDVIGVE
jgi:hypothetical protein